MLRFIRKKNCRTKFSLWNFPWMLNYSCVFLILESLFHRLVQAGLATELSEISTYYYRAYVFDRVPFKLAALEILQTEDGIEDAVLLSCFKILIKRRLKRTAKLQGCFQKQCLSSVRSFQHQTSSFRSKTGPQTEDTSSLHQRRVWNGQNSRIPMNMMSAEVNNKSDLEKRFRVLPTKVCHRQALSCLQETF